MHLPKKSFLNEAKEQNRYSGMTEAMIEEYISNVRTRLTLNFDVAYGLY